MRRIFCHIENIWSKGEIRRILFNAIHYACSFVCEKNNIPIPVFSD